MLSERSQANPKETEKQTGGCQKLEGGKNGEGIA